MNETAVPAPRPEPTFPLTEAHLESARKALSLGLCKECFGRLFGRLGHGLTNVERAERLFLALGVTPGGLSTPCVLCGGAFEAWETWVPRVVNSAQGLEWHRFSCGSRWDPERLAHEETIWVTVGTTHGESARGAFNRELGKRVEAITGASGGPDHPDVVFLADLPVGRVEVTILPLYLTGRYRKLDRTLPQTKWPCRRCEGRGCDYCSGTGKMYAESVEEIVAAPVLRATGGAGSKFHGMGREDIDARMLGDGRPFVLEIVRPHVRTLDLPALSRALDEEAKGRVEVLNLAPTNAEEVVRVKELAPSKSYRVAILGEVDLAKVNEALAFVAGRAIAQRTPTRVAHRRSDRVRTRRILEARLVESTEGRFTLDLRAEAGTYIKEWVEGDGGRTESSLAELLGVPLKVDSLDVLAIHDREG